MARSLTLVCDTCGKRSTGKSPIFTASGRRDDGYRFAVDICASCWKRLEAEFGVHQETRYSRDTYEVINFEDIE